MSVFCLLWAGAARGIDAQVKCEAEKNRQTGRYLACRQRAQARYVKTGELENYNDAVATCDARFLRDWNRLEQKAGFAGAACPDEPLDPNSLVTFLSQQCDTVAGALSGEEMMTCGDGAVNLVGEHCDGADLDGYSCHMFGKVGSLSCDESCDFDVTGCVDCEEKDGVVVSGYCWFYGTSGQSCDDVCAAAGLVYDVATRTFAGSEGSVGNCDAVLTALMAKGVPADVDGSGDYQGQSDGRGCATLAALGRCPEASPSTNSCWWWDPWPTTSSAGGSTTERACACR